MRTSAAGAARSLWLVFPLLAGWLMTPAGGVHGSEEPSPETFLTRTEMVVTDKSSGERTVQRWRSVAFSTGTSAWFRMEKKTRDGEAPPEGYFVSVREGRISIRRYGIDDLNWFPGELPPDSGIFGTSVQFRDLFLVQGGLNEPVRERLARDGFTITGIEGEKGPEGMKITSPEGWTRRYRYVSIRRNKGTVWVRKFRLSVPGEERSVVVEYRKRRRSPAAPGMFRSERDFLNYPIEAPVAHEGSKD